MIEEYYYGKLKQENDIEVLKMCFIEKHIPQTKIHHNSFLIL